MRSGFVSHFRVALQFQQHARNHSCSAIRKVPAGCVRVGRKNAGEAAAVSSAIKGGVNRDVAERVIASVQKAQIDPVVSEFVAWNDAEVLVQCATRSLPFVRCVKTGGVSEDAERAVVVSAPPKAHGSDNELIEDACSNYLAAVAIRGELKRGNGTCS